MSWRTHVLGLKMNFSKTKIMINFVMSERINIGNNKIELQIRILRS